MCFELIFDSGLYFSYKLLRDSIIIEVSVMEEKKCVSFEMIRNYFFNKLAELILFGRNIFN